MTNDYGIDDAALEQRIAELSDEQFDQLVTRTRPPAIGGAPIPNVGAKPQRPTAQKHLAALEAAGRWKEAGAVKAAQLQRLASERDQRR